MRRIFRRDVRAVVRLILGCGVILPLLFAFGALTTEAPGLDELDSYTGVFVERDYESNYKGPGDSVLYFRDGAVYISHGFGFRGGEFDAMVEPGDELRVLTKTKRGLFSERLRGYAVYRGDEAIFSYEDAAAGYAHNQKMSWIYAAVSAGVILLLAALAWVAEWRGYNRICREMEAARLRREEADRRRLRQKAFRHVVMTLVVEADGGIALPRQILSEYGLLAEGWVILCAKAPGSFGVTRSRLITQSKIGTLLEYRPELRDRTMPEGAFVSFKGCRYCWLDISSEGRLALSDELLAGLGVRVGDTLMLVKRSHGMFTLNTEGALLAKAGNGEKQK